MGAATPELPYLAAGVVALIGGAKREGRFPDNGLKAVIATVVLVLIASATQGSKIAPLVRAIGLVVLLGAAFGTVRAYQPKGK
jgi:hypothetical protein